MDLVLREAGTDTHTCPHTHSHTKHERGIYQRRKYCLLSGQGCEARRRKKYRLFIDGREEFCPDRVLD